MLAAIMLITLSALAQSPGPAALKLPSRLGVGGVAPLSGDISVVGHWAASKSRFRPSGQPTLEHIPRSILKLDGAETPGSGP